MRPRYLKAERELSKKAIADYRRRHRQWVMEALPSMSEAQWDKYLTWVAGFGGNNSRRTRKLKRGMNCMRENHLNAPGPLIVMKG